MVVSYVAVWEGMVRSTSRFMGVMVGGLAVRHFLKRFLKLQRRRDNLLNLLQRVLCPLLKAGLPRNPKMSQGSVVTPADECPYRNDWPVRLIVLVARTIEIPVNRLRGVSTPSEPNVLSVALVLTLAWHAVALIASTAEGVVWPDAGREKILPLSKDYGFLLAAVVFPLATAVAWSFYHRIHAIFDKLQLDGVLVEKQPGILSEHKQNLNRRLNSLLPSGFAVFAVFISIFAWGARAESYDSHWLHQLSLGVQAWLFVWLTVATFAVLFFAWKSIFVWHSIHRLTHFSDGFAFRMQDAHSDGCGGLRTISSLWLRVHYMVVLLGVWVFGNMVLYNEWTNLGFISGTLVYVVLAPILAMGPLYRIHSEMVKHRDAKVSSTGKLMGKAEKAVERKDQDPQSIPGNMDTLVRAATFHRESYERAKRLPTWPFNPGFLGKFLASYCVPFTVVGIPLLTGS